MAEVGGDTFDPNQALALLAAEYEPRPEELLAAAQARPSARANPATRRPDLGRYILNSATFGAADPVIAALASGPSYLVGKLTGSNESLGDIYSRVRQDLRAGEQATEQASPYLAPAAGIAGSIALGPGVLKMGAQGARTLGSLAAKLGQPELANAVGAGVNTLANGFRSSAPGRGILHLLRGAGEGAGSGALTALINQDGDPYDAALTGGTFGSLLGFGVAGTYGAARAARALKNKALPSQGWAEQNALQLLSNSIGPEAKLAQLEQDLRNNQGRPTTIFDEGGENIRSRGEAAYKQPGEGRDEIAQFLTKRMGDQPHRVAADLSLTLTPQINRGAALTIDSLNEMKRQLANPLYEKAYAYGRVASSELEPFIKRLEASGAMDEARQLAAIEGRDFTGFDRVGSGSRSIPAIDMRDVDLIQRGIRTAQEKALGDNGVATTRSRALGQLRETRDPDNPGFLDVIDSFNPDFKRARQVWAEGSGNEEAVNLGRKLLGAGTDARFDDALRAFKKLYPGEQDYFRLGLAQDIVDRMNKVNETADAAKTLLTPRMVNRMQQVFENPQDFSTFLSGLQKEALMGRAGPRVMGGSRTAQLLGETGGMNAETALHAGTALVTGNYHGLVKTILGSMAKHLNSPTMDRRTASELQRILFNPNPADNQRVLDQIRQMRAGQRPSQVGPGGQPVPMPDVVVDLSRGLATRPMLNAPEENQ